jgi:hypothetical protein
LRVEKNKWWTSSFSYSDLLCTEYQYALASGGVFNAKESVSLRLAATAYVLSEHKPCFPIELEAMTYAIFVVICQCGKENPYNCCGFKQFN